MLKTLFLYLIVSAAGLKLQAGFKVEEDPEKTPDGKLPPIAPVTFGDTSGCKDVYDHSHSVSAPFSNCNPPAEQSAKGKAAAEADKAAKKKRLRLKAKPHKKRLTERQQSRLQRRRLQRR